MKPLNIYFAAAIQGDNYKRKVAGQLVAWLIKGGHHIHTKHLTGIKLSNIRKILAEDIGIPLKNLNDDYAWDYAINGLFQPNLDLLIAECSGPSHGVGFEIAYTTLRSNLKHIELKPIPILILYDGLAPRGLSAMIKGVNPVGPWIKPDVEKYTDLADAKRIIKEFIKKHFC